LIQESYDKGAIVFPKGQACDSIIFIVSGQMELFVDSVESEKRLDILSTGSFDGAYYVFNLYTFKFSSRAKDNL